jgi:hypothetical protein
LGGDAADSDFGATSVDHQLQGLADRLQVVRALRHMHVAWRADHLGFDDDLVLGQVVGGVCADSHVSTMIIGCRTMPSPDFRIWWGKLLRKPFRRTRAERIGKPKSTPHDPFGHRPQQPQIPFIDLHPAHLPEKTCVGVRADGWRGIAPLCSR